jgi:hypothetical protein
MMDWPIAAWVVFGVPVMVGVLAVALGLARAAAMWRPASEDAGLRREVAILRAEVERLREMVERLQPEPRDAGSPHVREG